MVCGLGSMKRNGYSSTRDRGVGLGLQDQGGCCRTVEGALGEGPGLFCEVVLAVANSWKGRV